MLVSLWASRSTSCLLPTTLAVHCEQTLPQLVPGRAGFTVIGCAGGRMTSSATSRFRLAQGATARTRCRSHPLCSAAASWRCGCCAFWVKLWTKRLYNYAFCQKGSLEPVRGSDVTLKCWSYRAVKKEGITTTCSKVWCGISSPVWIQQCIATTEQWFQPFKIWLLFPLCFLHSKFFWLNQVLAYLTENGEESNVHSWVLILEIFLGTLTYLLLMEDAEKH